MKLFTSPADWTYDSVNFPYTPSYSVNAWAFHQTPNLNRTFTDGTSGTIVIAEKYADCGQQIAHDWASRSPITRATFADGGDVTRGANSSHDYPVTGGQPPVTVNAWSDTPAIGLRTFQVVPSRKGCDPRWPSTPHRSGMLVALADGSVRTLSPNIAPSIFWGAVTPEGGEILGGEW